MNEKFETIIVLQEIKNKLEENINGIQKTMLYPSPELKGAIDGINNAILVINKTQDEILNGK